MYIKYLDLLKEQQSIISRRDRFKFLEVLERKDIEEIAISLIVGREFTQGNDTDKDNKNIYFIIKNRAKNDLKLETLDKDAIIGYILTFPIDISIKYLNAAVEEQQKFMIQFI